MKQQLRSVSSLGEGTRMGRSGRYADTMRAVRPECDGQRIAAAPTCSAMNTAEKPVAALTLASPRRSWYALRFSRCSSVSTQMSDMVLTASAGYLPDAVSPESMTQSVPS